MKRIILGLTGASGSVFFKYILEKLIKENVEIHLLATENGEKVFEYELKHNLNQYIKSLNYKHIFICQINDMFNKIASGSFQTDGMIITPCSMGTIGKIAHGTSDNLLIRACDVQLKEKRPVLLAFREAPLSSIHLNNLLTLSHTSAIIYPLVPAFYTFPQTMDDMVNQITSRILSYFNLTDPYVYEWQGH